MLKKIVLAAGTAAIVWSLMNPIVINERIITGHTEPRESKGYLQFDPRPIYEDTAKTDEYRTNARTFAIMVGTAALWYIVPGGKKEKPDG